MTSKAKAYKAFSTTPTPPTDETRPPRVASFKATHSGSYPPWDASPGEQRPRSKMPPRKPRKANLSGIDEEPSGKAMRILGVDELEIKDGRIVPAVVVVGKARAGKRFYEGRFGGLGWSDAGSVK
jgi:hypothetical protein